MQAGEVSQWSLWAKKRTATTPCSGAPSLVTKRLVAKGCGVKRAHTEIANM